MTQPVIGTAAVAAAVASPTVLSGEPIVGSDGGEPTMEQLAALLPDADAAAPTVAEPPATEGEQTAEPTEPTTEDKPAEAAPKSDPAEDEALERAAKAAQKAREGSRRYAQTQEALRQQQAEVQRAAREAEQLRQENAAAKAREEALLKDPYKALKDRGMTDRDLAERALRENTPEAVTERLANELKAEREARLALEQRIESEQAKAKAAAEKAATQAEYIQHADDANRFPELSQLTSKAQLHWAVLALQTIEANGYSTKGLAPAQVAEAAEKLLSMSRKPGKTTAAAPAAKPAATGAKPSGKTLTNTMAQTRTVAPANWDDLSDEQQLAHIASSLPDPT